MKVKLRKQIHSSFATVSSRDEWVDMVVDIPFVPTIGMVIKSDAGLFERINEVIYNISTEETIAYVGEDNTFSDVKNQLENFSETPEFKALVQKYLDRGWEIKGE